MSKRSKLKQKPKNRKLFLDWFDSDEDHDLKSGGAVNDSMKKVMELMKLADSFKTNPEFDVNVEVSYRNPGANRNLN